mmetsp:Transcript_8857/g.25745  ORF Transcript_8857/g.25745 Transcript_8857/m.25745 type:complete len:220 (-) Transcript_8857:1135-1794(-)
MLRAISGWVSLMTAGGLLAVTLSLFLNSSAAPTINFGSDSRAVLSRDVEAAPSADIAQLTFAVGCFWGGELAMQRVPGVLQTEVGYAGGQVANPSYEQVCAGGTGHREAVRVAYDPSVVSLQQLLVVYWDALKDPTDAGGQGGDRGESYTLALFAQGREMRKLFEEWLQGKAELVGRPLAIQILDFESFYPAERYHQQYLEKNGQSSSKGDLTPIRCYG